MMVLKIFDISEGKKEDKSFIFVDGVKRVEPKV